VGVPDAEVVVLAEMVDVGEGEGVCDGVCDGVSEQEGVSVAVGEAEAREDLEGLVVDEPEGIEGEGVVVGEDERERDGVTVREKVSREAEGVRVRDAEGVRVRDSVCEGDSVGVGVKDRDAKVT
jgi:hypothetical protein